MKFLVDAQLPPALAAWLRQAGHDAEHVRDAGMLTASDTEVRAYAARIGAVIITKDRDFAPQGKSQESFVQIIWVRTGNISTRALIARVAAAWPQLVSHLSDGAPLIELR